MKPTKQLSHVSREERLSRLLQEAEEDRVALQGSTYQSSVYNLLSRDRGAFPFNTDNLIDLNRLEEIARAEKIPEPIATRLYNFLSYMGEHYNAGEPTDELAAHLYHQAYQMKNRNYGYRDFGQKCFELLGKYLVEQKLMPRSVNSKPSAK